MFKSNHPESPSVWSHLACLTSATRSFCAARPRVDPLSRHCGQVDAGLALLVGALLLLLSGPACAPFSEDAEGWVYQCETVAEAVYDHAGGPAQCGEGDPMLPPEPTYPTEDQICQTLVADKSFPDEDHLDTERVQAALDACVGQGPVKLVANGEHNAFITGHLEVNAVILWVDEGVTLFASRQAELYKIGENCGMPGANESGACDDFITLDGVRPGIIGKGAIDGQAGEPLVGRDYSWWQLSQALRAINGSIGNPTLIQANRDTREMLLYEISLHNPPKFHVKITSYPEDMVCDAPGEGFIVWGVNILTPSQVYNSQGLLMTPHFARNTDGIDPGTKAGSGCGVIACTTVTTSDDQIAIKGGHIVRDLVIAHNHFGTGHGMSIGSETFGQKQNEYTGGELWEGTQDVLVYDMTIDAASRSVGWDATDADFNGLRIKSDISRGGVVADITYRDICMRDMNNVILISTAYNPLFSGEFYPEFGEINFENVRHVSCMNKKHPTITIEGHSNVRRTGPVNLDNVVVDNVGPHSVYAEYADLVYGPGDVNFVPEGNDLRITDNRTGEGQPHECVFPTLPTPELPKGWLR